MKIDVVADGTGRPVSMEFDFRHGQWLFTDEAGRVWRLTPSGDPDDPLEITLDPSHGTVQ